MSKNCEVRAGINVARLFKESRVDCRVTGGAAKTVVYKNMEIVVFLSLLTRSPWTKRGVNHQ